MKRWLIYTLIVFFALLFCVSGWFIITYQKESTENEILYEDLSNIVEQIRSTLPTEPTAEVIDDSTTPTEPAEPTVLPEYAPIYALNNDLVGWIYIDGTTINYPWK